MENLISVLDGFVLGLKENPEFGDVRFIHSGRNKYAEKPVKSFLVACGVNSEVIAPFEYVRGKLEFMVYAPDSQGKRELSQMCERLANTLKEKDSLGIVKEIYVEVASFDRNLTVWCQRIIASVYLCDTDASDNPDQGDYSLTVGSREISGVKSFSAVCNRDFYVVRELLSGDTSQRVMIDEIYILTIKVKSKLDVFENPQNEDMNIYFSSTREEYRGCIVESSELKVTPTDVEREYRILCTKGRELR